MKKIIAVMINTSGQLAAANRNIWVRMRGWESPDGEKYVYEDL